MVNTEMNSRLHFADKLIPTMPTYKAYSVLAFLTSITLSYLTVEIVLG